ncbi:YezD family protein [Paenibacillus lignilyticus]|uniref:YezD family protein n=1 Tax=Paenibacillus lignilyticus TaxID=1172615 RepID=A0ABS5C8E9_9BACL|nr:YezD family protein [Paenibacillus lignilyticus]MBP3962257.1 YezD family protein [Paenibacillus lignilyticus]
MAKPIVLDQEWLERIATQVNGLEYGSVLITVHDGRVVQIDRTERKRFDAATAKTGQNGQQRQEPTNSSTDKLKAVNG